MKQYQIIIGELEAPLFSFKNNDVKSCAIESEINFVGEELTLDVAEIEVVCRDDNIRTIPYSTKVQIFNQERLLSKFYVTKIERIKETDYKLTATSAIGIIANDTFYGDIYAGTSQTVEKVLSEIIGTNGLQPYSGYYRGMRTIYPSITPRIIGKYKAKDSSVGSKACLSATMCSRMVTSFTILQSKTSELGETLGQLVGEDRFVFCGCAAAASETDETKLAHQYGLYMDVTYNKSTKVWQEYGEMFFVYGNAKYSLGTPTDNTYYEIDINPLEGKATINGIDYAITAGDNEWLIPLHVCSGGARLYLSNSNAKRIDGYNENLYFICEFNDYKLYDESGSLQCDAVYVRDQYYNSTSQNGCAFDLANNSMDKNTLRMNFEPLSELIEANESEHPTFHKKSYLEEEILNKLVINDAVKKLIVIGWIKPCTKREALQQLLFATGVIIKKTLDGDLLITTLAKDSVKNLDEGRIYIGGSVNYHEQVNSIELTEYGFQNVTVSAETVYENQVGSSDYYFAIFSKAPVVPQTVASNDLTIMYKTANAAIVSGTGSVQARPYKQSESVLKRILDNEPNGKTISIKDVTLVTMHNSQNVLDRMEAYYGSANVVKESIVINDEMCGDRYTIKTPYRESKEAYLTKKTETLSGIIKSDCEFLVDYDPPSIGEEFSKYVVLTGNGTWDVPVEVYQKEYPRIRAILIGGGDGGNSGYAGEDGKVPDGAVAVEKASGGAGGSNGKGGYILDVTIDNPATEYQYACGIGGAGGDISTSTEINNVGSPGGNTTLSDGETIYNSGDGAKFDSGITNFLTGVIYGRQLSNYVSKGGDGGYYTMDGNTPKYNPPETIVGSGFEVAVYAGGVYGNYYVSSGNLIAAGGCGGGGAYGENGGDGTDATSRLAGSGGKGADAIKTPSKVSDYSPLYYGCGGLGGAGGGGGGASGPYNPNRASKGVGGSGGYGGHGGDGGDGCVLIYY